MRALVKSLGVMVRSCVMGIYGVKGNQKKLERFTNLRVILAKGPCLGMRLG